MPARASAIGGGTQQARSASNISRIESSLCSGSVASPSWCACATDVWASASPLLANVYLHYVFDLWAHQWRCRHASGEVIIVRYADDYIVGFQHQRDAQRFLAELPLNMSVPPKMVTQSSDRAGQADDPNPFDHSRHAHGR